MLAMTYGHAQEVEIIRVNPKAPPAVPTAAELTTARSVLAALDRFDANAEVLRNDPVKFRARAVELQSLAKVADARLPLWGPASVCRHAAGLAQATWDRAPSPMLLRQYGEHKAECRALVKR